MKAKTSLLLLALAAFSLAGQSPIHLSTQMKVGEENKYKIHISGSASFGDVDIIQTKTEKVVKVYDNGDADVLTTVTSQHVLWNGNVFNAPTEDPSTHRVNKNGAPVDPKDPANERIQFSNYLPSLFDHDIKVGDTVQINQTAADGKDKSTGTIKVDSLADGELKLIVDLLISHDTQAPTVFKGTFLVNEGDSKLDKVDGSIQQLNLGEGRTLDDAKFTLERLHS